MLVAACISADDGVLPSVAAAVFVEVMSVCKSGLRSFSAMDISFE